MLEARKLIMRIQGMIAAAGFGAPFVFFIDEASAFIQNEKRADNPRFLVWRKTISYLENCIQIMFILMNVTAKLMNFSLANMNDSPARVFAGKLLSFPFYFVPSMGVAPLPNILNYDALVKAYADIVNNGFHQKLKVDLRDLLFHNRPPLIRSIMWSSFKNLSAAYVIAVKFAIQKPTMSRNFCNISRGPTVLSTEMQFITGM